MPRLFRIRERINIQLENTGDNNSVSFEDGNQDDIIPETKKKMAQYVSDITKEGGNQPYLIAGGFDGPALQDQHGNPAGFAPDFDTNSTSTSHLQKIRENAGDNVAALFENTSHSGQLDTQEQGRFVVRKGKSSLPESVPNGEDILLSLNRLGDSAPFAVRVDQVLVDNNGFSESKPFFPTLRASESSEEAEDNFTVSHLQKIKGIHGPRRFPTTITTGTEESTILKIKELKKIGLLTMLAGSGELDLPVIPGESELVTTIVPGLARLGQRIPVSKFNAARVYKEVNPNFDIPTTNEGFVDNGNVLSYGNTNNYVATFSGQNSLPSVVSATAMMLTVGGLIKATAAVYSALSERNNIINTDSSIETQSYTVDERVRRLGSHEPKPLHKIPNGGFQINVVKTVHNFMDCVSKGTNLFFGLTENGNSFIDLASEADNLAAVNTIGRNHGYYNVVLRNIIRNVTSFISPVVNSVDKLSSTGEFQDFGNVLDSFNPISNLEKLNSSVVLQFMNTLATMGDVALSAEDINPNVDFASAFDAVKELYPNAQGLNPAILHVKNRLSNGKLAWRQTTARSMYILPDSLMSAGRRFGGNKENELLNIAASGDDISTKRIEDGKGTIFVSAESDLKNSSRIKQEIVAKMENYLEKDYMPFYFHDLRTNEIISFHAFLDGVSDSFEASFNETEGFGRVDKVYTYKSTNRSLNVSFKLVALDEEDQSHMWYKINKLVTLVYPQWTKGREISWGDNKMIQPFSQQPSSTPMVRMRLGDLFKTNYSKFAVARLFGISDDASKFKLENITSENNDNSFETQRRFIENLSNIRDLRQENEYTEGSFLMVRPNYQGPNQQGFPRANAVGTPSAQGLLNRNGTPRIDRGLVLSYTTRAMVVEATQRGATHVKIQLTSPGEGETGVFTVPFTQTFPDERDIQITARRNATGSTASDTSSTTQQENQSAIDAFLNSETNPIFKSFESTKGKGLAGVIKSIRYDFSETTWSTENFNGRVPTIVKVEIDFAPIHDIAPGIDSNGFMTAPVYNAGRFMNNLATDDSIDIKRQETEFNSARRSLNITGIGNGRQ